MKAKLSERQKLREQAQSDYVNFSTNGNPVGTGAVFSAGGSGQVERSSTVVQENGVDEDDLIKSDGSFIYTLSREGGSNGYTGPTGITINRRRQDGNTEVASRWVLGTEGANGVRYSGMFLDSASKRAVALGSSSRYVPVEYCNSSQPCSNRRQSVVSVEVVNVANAAQPTLTEKLRIDGQLVGSRMIGTSLILVTQFAPQPMAEIMPWNAAASERSAALARLTTQSLLPSITTGGAATQPLVSETECYLEARNANYSLDITTITVVDMASGNLQRSSRCFIGGTESIYMSPSALYLATSNTAVMPAATSGGIMRLTFPNGIQTDIHKFALAGGDSSSLEYRGSGTVPGHLGWSRQQRPYRMGEYNGDLRVLTFTGASGWGGLDDLANTAAPKPSPATLTVLRESSGAGRRLQVVGQLPNEQRPGAIGKPGEQVYAVRFVGNRGYVVTFRRTDPLYVLDLSNPIDPKATGELTVAGFSDYLLPVGPAGSGLLLGVGRDADANGFGLGVKVALFDVANPAKPTQVATTTIGNRYAYSALEVSSHGIDLFTRGNQTRVVLPVLSDSNGTSQFELQRFEVDTAARTMKQVNPLTPTNVSSQYHYLDQDRTLQIGDKVHYSNGESLSTQTW